jgi:hypothetical protein
MRNPNYYKKGEIPVSSEWEEEGEEAEEDKEDEDEEVEEGEEAEEAEAEVAKGKKSISRSPMNKKKGKIIPKKKGYIKNKLLDDDTLDAYKNAFSYYNPVIPTRIPSRIPTRSSRRGRSRTTTSTPKGGSRTIKKYPRGTYKKRKKTPSGSWFGLYAQAQH